MTVASETSSITYTLDEEEPGLVVPFVYLDNSEVVLRLTRDGESEIILTEGAHYTLADNALLLTVLYSNGDTLVVERTVPFVQLTSFVTQGNFSPSTHEDQFDELVFMAQQLHRRLTVMEAQGSVGSVVAGTGLSFTSTTLNVGQGDGLVVGANDVAVDFGVAGDMVAVTADSNNAGTEPTVARIDHRHTISTAAPAAGAVLAGNSAATGSATSLSRSDHIHTVTTAAPSNVIKQSAAAGSATSLSRSDHKHDVTVGTPVSLTASTNGTGSATSLVRSDHTHAHGDLAGGSLHDVAVAGVSAGFISGADKTKLDAMPLFNVVEDSGSTDDDAPARLLFWAPDETTSETVIVRVTAYNETTNEAAGYVRTFVTKTVSSTTSLVGSVGSTHTAEDESTMDVTISFDVQPFVQVLVTGVLNEDIHWYGSAERLAVGVS